MAVLDEDALPIDGTNGLAAGSKGYLVTDRTPFYGASGGQTGDTGSIATATGVARVTDTLKPATDLTVHAITVDSGELLPDQEATLNVEESCRLATARNHTCTHLLHAALRRRLGDHVRQAGSLVSADRLRFDFTHIAPLTPEDLAAVERDVNSAILRDLPLSVRLMDREAAREAGAMALFNEKYGETVRVVSVGDHSDNQSIELCGGTHLRSTGEAGSFAILSETGVAAGVRRIEAVTGWNTLKLFEEMRTELARAASVLKSRPGELPAKAEALVKENRTLRKELEKSRSACDQKRDLASEAVTLGGVRVVGATLPAIGLKALRELMDDTRSKLPSGVACLVAPDIDKAGKVNLLLYVSKDLHDRFTAPALIKAVAAPIAGSGGGRPDLAQAGGTRPEGMDEALAVLRANIAG